MFYMLPGRIRFRNNPFDRRKIVEMIREGFKRGKSVVMCIPYGKLKVMCYFEPNEELRAKLERIEFPIFEGELRDVDERMRRIIEEYERTHEEVVFKLKYYRIMDVLEEEVEEKMTHYA
ncbi:MAG TPA: hypothetical protein ENF26_00680 [Methanomicrobia archaeon]|nr:hypothetical protein [Methanomicrobia archaeon]HEX58653.1 hypothetical protein [Methanomicrobia archaeon]